MGDFKAISQNMMHANLSVTEGVYGVFSEKGIRDQILALGQEISSNDTGSNEKILAKLEEIAQSLKK